MERADEPEVLESYVTKIRDRKAALKFLRKSMRRHGRPDTIATDCLRSYGADLRDLGRSDDRKMGRWLNNRAENSHVPYRRRDRAMLRFRRMRTLQRFVSVHALVQNHFNQDRRSSSRSIFMQTRATALVEWRGLLEAQEIVIARKLSRVRIGLTAPQHDLPHIP